MATTSVKTLSPEERSIISAALAYFQKGSERAVTSNSEPALKDFYQKRAYRIQALKNRFINDELEPS